MKPLFIGIDPDLHDTGIAVATLDEVLWVGTAHIKGKFKGHDAVLASIAKTFEVFWTEGGADVCQLSDNPDVHVWVESQRVYERHQKANPNNLIHLAQVAGGVTHLIGQEYDSANLVYPQDWKGQTEKYINQKRTYEHYGWKSKVVDHYKSKSQWYSFPVGDSFDLDYGAWKHVGDALGIALWAAKEHEKVERREAAKKANGH